MTLPQSHHKDSNAPGGSPPRLAGARSWVAESQVRTFSVAGSLIFWASLGAAGLLFAALALAPKMRTYRDLRLEYEERQRVLVAQERQHDYLVRVADALIHDADFAAEIARIDFGVTDSEERIPVSAELSFQGPPQEGEIAISVPPPPPRIWETTLLDVLADATNVRGRLMGAVSMLVVVAFVFGSGFRERRSSQPKSALRVWFANRYAMAWKPVGNSQSPTAD